MTTLVAFAVLLFSLCALLKRRFEELLPCVVCAAMLVLFPLAQATRLSLFHWIAAGAAALCLAAFLARGLRQKALREYGRNALRRFFTPGFCCFALATTLFCLAAPAHRVYHTDDLYEWALQPMSLLVRDGLTGPTLHLSPRFMTYTPGVALFQWIGLSLHGEWAEGTAFLWLWILYAAYLLPLTSGLSWREAWKIPLWTGAIVLLPAVLQTDAYRTLRVDSVLGICLALCIVYAWRLLHEPEGRRFWIMALILCLSALTLIKQTGIAWALLPVLMLLALDRKRPLRRRFSYLWLLLPPLLIFGEWKLFCSVKGLSGMHLDRLNGALSQLFSGDGFSSGSELLTLLVVLLKAFATLGLGFDTGALHLPPLWWYALCMLAFFLLERCGRLSRASWKRLSLGLSVAFAVYFLAFYAALLTAFRAEWTDAEQITILNNIRRYGDGLWAASLALCLWLLRAPEEGGRAAARVRLVRLGALALTAVCLLCVEWIDLAHQLVPGHYPVPEISLRLDALRSDSFWADDVEEPENVVVLLTLDSYPSNYDWLQYVLAPMKVVLPYGVKDEEGLRDKLRDNQCGYFVSEGTENEIFALAQSFAGDGEELYDYTLYAVEWDGDTPILTEAEQ